MVTLRHCSDTADPLHLGFTRLGEAKEPKLIKRLHFHSGHSLFQLNRTVITLHELIGVIGPA